MALKKNLYEKEFLSHIKCKTHETTSVFRKEEESMPFFQYKNIDLCYEDLGKGIPIIFIHPPAMGRKVFHFQKLLSNKFRVILPDLSGHGDTIGFQKDITIAGYAEEVEALCNHLKLERAAVCGYSSGGLIAQEFALKYPERTLAVILSGGFPEVRSPGLGYEHMAGMYMVKNCPNLLAWLISMSHTDDKMVSKDIYQHMLKANRTTWFRFYEQSLHYSCVSRLNQWRPPLFLLYGSKDFINQHIRTYKKHVPFQLAIIKKASHQLPTKNWEIFNQLITGFLLEKIK